MQYKIITTIGPNSWDRYAKRFVESFLSYWPAEASLEIWHHHLGDDVPSHPGVTFRRLDDTPAFKAVSQALGPQAKDGPSLAYCFKAIALSHSITADLDWIGFIDADTETMRPVTPSLLANLFDSQYDLTYLYRKSVRESEGSWFAFNLRSVNGASLLHDYYGVYTSLEFLHFKKQTDNAILDRLVNIHAAHGLMAKNLSAGALGLDAFHQSPLGAYLIHYKGPNKNTIADPGLGTPARYETLCEVVQHAAQHTGESNIVEIGTWNGSRAIQMAEAAFSAGALIVTYTGFDTFDEGNDRALEGHTKPHASHATVEHRLDNYAQLMWRSGKIFTFRLIKGNTNVTLPSAKEHLASATFAYIDGGHSYETVLSDYEALKHVPYIVFDDVVKGEHADAPDGPRRVFESAAGNKRLAVSQDRYYIKGQFVGDIGLGIVSKPGLPVFDVKQKIQVKPVDSVDKSIQLEYIVENTDAIPEWLSSYQAHGRVALLVSAGPTLPDYLKDIKAKQNAGAVVFCVKHAYPMLREAGIRPDFTVVLDPRPVDGISTHGVVRTSLFEGMGPADKVLLASMTHPSVRLELEKARARLIGWHAQTASFASDLLTNLKKGLVVGGGTCSATRMPMLAFTMGFRRFEFFGYDFFYPADTPATQLKQALMKVTLGDNAKEFLTTGELVAAMQDLGQWNKWLVSNGLSVTFHGDGAGTHIWNSTVKKYTPPQEYPF